ncbi:MULTISPECIES: LPS export ABC transporter ATP-binding protein [Oceanotoga]|jgi:lipopolysaccharide export system ATP-binding protein|uniref:Lipopolysaccharide export system ATP-binding protein n=1 Tax=Oceanotoga teriensis TaxID=515440 RepID=A0AA45C6A8_9BACT|nr:MULTISPECIES: LPS export ABC transporter ATP-binding protein [Oceanotoga]MDN5343109.1 lipopolysaccharide export system ATP-binding protein [Oceanotoga sp.]MDO7977562.1 LPS export ABC transporter ATP-binding protein [Oceanotoga teriensis]PWJ91218.1 lipopolysaccharide export system ATP-binding protein [Oceanotoga teriensis]
MNNLVECIGIYKKYGRKEVLKNVNFYAERGKITGILGPNGAGKSTLFKSILGLVIPNKGDVYLDGEKLTHLPIHRRALKGMAYLPQEPSVFKNSTVKDNLYMIADLLKIENKDEKIKKISEDFGIQDLLTQYADSLSGGEKRRLEFARTLLINPKVIMLDEPFVGIDPITVKDIQTIIKKLSKDGISVIVTDHNVDEIAQVVDDLYVVHKGNIIAHGIPQEVLELKEVKDNYLGY